jgi:hypothetical protein
MNDVGGFTVFMGVQKMSLVAEIQLDLWAAADASLASAVHATPPSKRPAKRVARNAEPQRSSEPRRIGEIMPGVLARYGLSAVSEAGTTGSTARGRRRDSVASQP